MDKVILFTIRVLIFTALVMILLIGLSKLCGSLGAEEPKIEMSETFSVMVMSDNFEAITNKVKFTVMTWNGGDEAAALRQENLGRPATTREIWLASVSLSEIELVEKDGMSGFDWAEVSRTNENGDCSKVKLMVSHKVDLDF